MQRIKNRRGTRWQTGDENKVRSRAFRLLHERIRAAHNVFVLVWKCGDKNICVTSVKIKIAT